MASGIKIALSPTDALIYGGAVVAIGGLIAGAYYVQQVWAQPPPPPPPIVPDNVAVIATPASIAKGGVIAINATFSKSGQPVTVSKAYYRLVQGAQIVVNGTDDNVAVLNKTIDTSQLAVGDYQYQVSDRPDFT